MGKNLTEKMFNEELRKGVESAFPGKKAEVVSIQKPTGKMTGIKLLDADGVIAPTAYTHQYYEKYAKGMLSLEGAIESICDDFRNADKEKVTVPEISRDALLGGVIPCIVSADADVRWVESVVTRPFLNLRIYYRWILKELNGSASIVVNKDLLKQCGLSEDELYEAALNNAKADTQLRSMESMLGDLIQRRPPEAEPIDLNLSKCPRGMYVATGSRGMYGAYALLAGDWWESVAKAMDDDVYIIPSSVHELIALPKSMATADDLRGMIHDVNRSQLGPGEMVSDELYEYDRGSDGVTVVAR